ncbi:MAG: DUF362 domain-containing protein [Butyrivibrio sp.]|nr:DUF362 domain-containing protein [Butyrivibrio sp.]
MNYFYFDESIEYPTIAPYHPESLYDEYPFSDDEIAAMPNNVYSSIRNMFVNMELDKDNIGTKCWNPLRSYIRPGQTVLLKPNLVNHKNPTEKDFKKGMDCLITHPSLVRCIFDYVVIALQGKGRVIIADAPIQDCDFDCLLSATGYGKLFDYFKEKTTDNLEILTADLRAVTYRREGKKVVQSERNDMMFPGVNVDLGEASCFSNDKNCNKVRITNYDGSDTVSSHIEGKNVYSLSAAVLEADVIISLPKPKTHRIAGYTAALKNFIGVNARKEYLPHHKIGSAESGGDEYSGDHRFMKWINSRSNDLRNHAVKCGHENRAIFYDEIGRKTGKKLDKYNKNRYKFGMWHGNDTIWRTIIDVNHAVLFADKEGEIKDKPQRRIINIGDMIVCGEKEGPLRPSYKKLGGVLFSENAVEFDMFVVKIMGFDWKKIPVLKHASLDSKLGAFTGNIVIYSNDKRFSGNLDEINENYGFKPTSGWEGHI